MAVFLVLFPSLSVTCKRTVKPRHLILHQEACAEAKFYHLEAICLKN
jgi:hypothetical protein